MLQAFEDYRANNWSKWNIWAPICLKWAMGCSQFWRNDFSSLFLSIYLFLTPHVLTPTLLTLSKVTHWPKFKVLRFFATLQIMMRIGLVWRQLNYTKKQKIPHRRKLRFAKQIKKLNKVVIAVAKLNNHQTSSIMIIRLYCTGEFCFATSWKGKTFGLGPLGRDPCSRRQL